MPFCKPSPSPARAILLIHLLGAGAHDGWWGATVLDGAGAATASLDGLDDAHRGSITWNNLAEDDVAAVEPAGDDGGDEELGAVARFSR